jgi:exodeoxyribonuclease VII small subunit
VLWKRALELVKSIATTPTWEYSEIVTNNGINLMNDIAAKTESLEKVTFEDALRELEGIVASLERGEVSLDDAINAFERGTQLKSHCQARLEEARMKVEKIKVPAAGGAPDSVSNFDMSES